MLTAADEREKIKLAFKLIALARKVTDYPGIIDAGEVLAALLPARTLSKGKLFPFLTEAASRLRTQEDIKRMTAVFTVLRDRSSDPGLKAKAGTEIAKLEKKLK
jgi:hypothetical protein